VSAAPSLDDRLDALTPGGGARELAIAGAVREHVAAVRAYLSQLHAGGASGQTVNEEHSDLMDRLVRRLFELAEEGFFVDGAEAGTDLCVVAVGGYARRELSLYSDVDLLFLFRDTLTPYVASMAERMQYWLWDAALTVGGATRTIAETVELARTDPTVATSVLAPRFLVGSGVLFHEFAERLRAELLSDPAAFVDSQLEGQQQRRIQYGDSLYLLQPNVKESPGGLRDYHTAYWIMQATHPAARGREDFLHLGLLTEAEADAYQRALDFQWRVRNELHQRCRRKDDRMSFELQEQMAETFGYGGTDSAELPVEGFMRDYYRHARAVLNYSSLVIEQCRARVSRPQPRRVREVEGGFRVANDQLEIPHSRQLREQPLRLLEAFAVAQAHNVTLTRKAGRLIRQNLGLIDDEFRRSAEAREVFLSILEAKQRVTSALVAMNEAGLLGRYLPEWEHIVCRWQHVMYHTYTVDVHSIFLVEELRRLWLGDHEKTLPELTEIMRGVEDRAALFLGCLLHDIGKGFGGDHSAKGAARARVCLERLGLEPERAERAIFLVEHHLLMSQLAQSRDLSDPKIILDFARTVGDRTNLRNLYLLTFADVRASSPRAWTQWRGQLLRELFERTSELLEAGADDRRVAVELAAERLERRQEASAQELRKLGIAEARVQAYLEMMPRRYFAAHMPRQVARHALVVLGLPPDGLMRTAYRRMKGGFTEFILATKDVHGLYANVAGTLTAHAINILGAHVYTARSGLALEVYRVTTPAQGEEEEHLLWEEFERSLESVLRGEIDVERLLKRRGRPLGAGVPPSRLPTRVEISNDVSDFYTVADVVTNDRLGLLHDLTRAIAEHELEIYISKAGQVLDQVSDTFYLKDSEGRKVTDREVIESLRDALLAAAEAGEGAVGR
jgi:[protein-PII] uridylyltransferase